MRCNIVLILSIFSCMCCVQSVFFLLSCTNPSYLVLLKQGQQLVDRNQDRLASENGSFFKLSFLSPGTSSASAIPAIVTWGTKLPISHPDAVWVANSKTPLSDSSGVFTSDSDAKLKIVYGGGQIPVLDTNPTGVLADGQQIAVKRFARNSGQGLEEFINEITLIAELQHSNLVQILGCCIQGEEKILLYEFLTNTSFDGLPFRDRIIHRDFKASNILLDEIMNRLTFQGLCIISFMNALQLFSQYAMKGIFFYKSDVYSFGVLLLEIVSGKKKLTPKQNLNDCKLKICGNKVTLELKDA
ncbi:hypothetical protein ACFX1S_017938 [Malus domestica]